ncbi:AI-2E family transporter [Clostridium fermenticellae]|uniref:AI-2E family transporter n=1 Tax=Clostridium fermenticellae TaxID=2068654 RepID=A0A386H0M1_9CLOT|nr:AI-2E family transporter [Clostridium fermenticellae]
MIYTKLGMEYLEFLKGLFKKDITKVALIFIFIIVVLWLLRSIIDLMLLTFLFTYLIYSVQQFIYHKISKFIKIKQSFITIILYLFIFTTLFYFTYKYFSIIVSQSIVISNKLARNRIDRTIVRYLSPILGEREIKEHIMQNSTLILKFVADIGTWGFNAVIALLLSMFFIIERMNIKKFVSSFANSRVSGIYSYIYTFSRDFIDSFGKVVQVQVLIAFINTIISIIILNIMKFPALIALTFMIFIFSLVPVAGTILASIPLAIIAYTIGGTIKVIYVVIMIILLYTIETYILNPKFMSERTRLPVFFVFIIIIISEHFMGVSGMLIGVPLFIYLVHLVGVHI